ncbi:MAG TPA: arginine-tRNA-protein transferase [Blastocatellia bacterium]|nr:arginine-tRNA-protein transferase [Blastocatellia bacterium]
MSEAYDLDEYFFADEVTPEQMDYLWAHGWRHFGVFFFRYATLAKSDGHYHVMPLRLKLADFSLSTSQKRVIKKNEDLRVEIRAAAIDATKEALFHRHKTRFEENVPNSIYDFFTPHPALIPCVTKEICLFQEDRLLAASFLDIGAAATSSVYSIYEPTETKRSLGIYLILLSIVYSLELGMQHYYPGYAYHEPSHYDYKKRFSGLEQFDWQEWKPLLG